MTTPKTTPIISTECQNDAKAHMYGFNGMPKWCKGPRVVSTECQNDAKAKTFATFALPPALNWWVYFFHNFLFNFLSIQYRHASLSQCHSQIQAGGRGKGAKEVKRVEEGQENHVSFTFSWIVNMSFELHEFSMLFASWGRGTTQGGGPRSTLPYTVDMAKDHTWPLTSHWHKTCYIPCCWVPC